MSNETASDTENNNGLRRLFHINKKPYISIQCESTTTSASSKLNHSIAHSKRAPRKKPVSAKKPHFTMVKSKSDLNCLKTYPDSFTIITSPKRSPSAGNNQNKRRKNNEDDEDSIMDFDWVKPPPEKLYEAASAGEKYHEEPAYISDHFGQHISIPSSPIVTDKIIVGSSHR